MLPDNFGEASLCDACKTEWERAKALCLLENCGQPMTVFDEGMMNTERGGAALWAVYYTAGTRLSTQNRIIFRLKERGDIRTVKFAARELAGVLISEASFILPGGAEHENAVITWIPRSYGAVVRYGFDHMKRTANALAGLLELEACPLLCRSIFTGEQKRLGRKARMDNAVRSMYVSEKYAFSGKTVVLIDDIITSGASLHAASELLLSAGAERVIAVCLAASDRPLY